MFDPVGLERSRPRARGAQQWRLRVVLAALQDTGRQRDLYTKAFTAAARRGGITLEQIV